MRYLVIRTPIGDMLKKEIQLDVLENVTSIRELKWRLEALSSDDKHITAVSVVDILLALGIIESDELKTVKEFGEV